MKGDSTVQRYHIGGTAATLTQDGNSVRMPVFSTGDGAEKYSEANPGTKPTP